MADINIINLEAGKGACDSLKGVISSLDPLRSDKSAFHALASINPSMEGNFQNEYNNSIEDIYNFLNGNIYPAAVEYFKDDNSDGTNKTRTTSSGSGRVSGGGNNYTGPSGTGDVAIPSITIPDVPDPELDTDKITKEELDKIDKSSVEKMSLSDFNGLMNELVELAKLKNVTLDELLLDDKYADLIKQTLLASPYVPQEFKNIILELDSKKVRALFAYILSMDYPDVFNSNSLNLGITYSYLEKIAEENGIEVNDLLNKKENQNLLKESLSKYDNVIELIKGWENLPAEEFQDQLKSFYLGDVPEEFPNEDIIATRAFVDYLAKECDVSYEEFLNDSSYASTLKDGAVEYGKSIKYFETITHCSDEKFVEYTRDVFNGKKYKAYGMSDSDLSSFKQEIDSLAKKNNTTTDNLFSDSKYSDEVKSTLLGSNSTKSVGSIYENTSSNVSQNVAKNLYNTKLETKSTKSTK